MKLHYHGVNLIFTMHGSDISDVTRRGEVSRLVQNGLFENVVILSNEHGPGSVRSIYKKNNLSDFEEIKGVF